MHCSMFNGINSTVVSHFQKRMRVDKVCLAKPPSFPELLWEVENKETGVERDNSGGQNPMTQGVSTL